jgi:NADPH-dependent 2,4-dienoyl-CoA reductase/sulfur reductase-like enzyme
MMTADFLVESGREVSFVTTCRTPGPLLDPMTGRFLYQKLADQGVSFHTETKVTRLTDDGVEIEHQITRERGVLLDAVTLVAACGSRSRDMLYHQLCQKRPQLAVRLVGDALTPRYIEQAVYDGHLAGRAV